MLSSGAILKVAAGCAAASFLGYCIYFDRKRRSHPLFKERLRDKRNKERCTKEQRGLKYEPQLDGLQLDDPSTYQEFLTRQVQIAEKCLMQGEMEKAAEHFAFALALHPYSNEVLQQLNGQIPGFGVLVKSKIPFVMEVFRSFVKPESDDQLLDDYDLE